MSRSPSHEIIYPTVREIVSIHDDIVEEDEDATVGVRDEGQVDYILACISEGHFGRVPEGIHEKAATLMRLLAANHAFVDGNKRTALNATWTFYAMNGIYFDYGEEIKAILKLFAVMEEMVDFDEVVSYFSDITYSSTNERVPTGIIETVHLTHWYMDIDRRFYEMTSFIEEFDLIEDGELVDDWPEGVRDEYDFEEFIDLLSEHRTFYEQASDFIDQYSDTLPDDVLESFGDIIAEWEDIQSGLVDSIESEDPELETPVYSRLIEEEIIDEEDITNNESDD